MAGTGTSTVLSSGIRRKRPHKYICGVPDSYCIGSATNASNGLRKSHKMHGSPQQAFKCYARYLLGQGYTQVGPREFAAPNGGEIMVLTKKCRFGARCRGGKAERFMPTKMLGGHIVC
jgi:hypothetical protein